MAFDSAQKKKIFMQVLRRSRRIGEKLRYYEVVGRLRWYSISPVNRIRIVRNENGV